MFVFIWNKATDITRHGHVGGVVATGSDLNDAREALKEIDFVLRTSTAFTSEPDRKIEVSGSVSREAFAWATEVPATTPE